MSLLQDLIEANRTAVAEEASLASRPMKFRVESVAWAGALFYMELHPSTKHARLDEALEDGTVSWVGPECLQGGEIVSVLPDISQIYVEYQDGPPPKPGDTAWIRPPKFLEALKGLWSSGASAQSAASWKLAFETNCREPSYSLSANSLENLRPKQKEAFDLPAWNISYLWGPPGTGKTRTLGCILAQYAISYPTRRILLLSTTNTAVDQALVSVDDALKRLSPVKPIPCLRFGSRFDPKLYESERQHLVPLRDKSLLQRYRRHLESSPSRSSGEPYYLWKKKLEDLRKAIQDETSSFLQTARIAAMTATSATFRFPLIEQTGKYDLIVFDEASQLSASHALVLSTLGKRILFAGDPHQLSPIVQSDSETAVQWMGQSPFRWKDLSSIRPAVVALDEQWRMVAPICDIVQRHFYPGISLRVADPIREIPAWHAQRQVLLANHLGDEHISLIFVADCAKPGKGFSSYLCQKSAELSAAIAAAVEFQAGDSNILILTPFRAQRSEIQKELLPLKLKRTRVSTIHRAQGSESRVVIFDPVKPGSEFVTNEEGKRLTNVAISRAQGQLIILLQLDFKENEFLRSLAATFPRRLLRIDDLPRARAEPFASPTSQNPVPPPAPPSVQVPIKPEPPSLLEEFKQELREKLAFRGSIDEKRWLAIEVANNLKYKKLRQFERYDIVGEMLRALSCE